MNHPKLNNAIKRYFRWPFFSVLIGILAGSSSSIFLILLNWATDTRDFHPVLIYGLPLAGFIVGWIYYRYGREANRGHNLIIDEIHDPKKIIPFRMAPLVLFGTLMTHLFGGSAGREGTAVQMGASLADQLTRFFKIEIEERKILLAAGAGAGFGSAIGAPWAGVIFGMEVIYVGKLKPFALFECLVASFAGYGMTYLLRAPHTHYPEIQIPSYNLTAFGIVILCAIAFGLSARIFILMTHAVEKIQAKISYPPIRPLLGGILLVILFMFDGTFRYVGLGIPYIQQALSEATSFLDPLWKAVFTAITIGSEFKGGEFIPLVFIGTTLGSAMGAFFPAFFQLLAGLGFAAVFGAASNTPLACSIMAIEIFGPRIAPFAVISCFMSYFLSGPKGIYKTQRTSSKKTWILK
jgi:H+/Cl- antiporter ClcA